jgi:hypothetical protein
MVLVRNAVFGFLRLVARGDYVGAAAALETGEDAWQAPRLEAAFALFYAEHQSMRTDAAGRSPSNLLVEQEEIAWKVQQIIVDSDDANDWVLKFEIPIAPSREAGRPLLLLRHVGT